MNHLQSFAISTWSLTATAHMEAERKTSHHTNILNYSPFSTQVAQSKMAVITKSHWGQILSDHHHHHKWMNQGQSNPSTAITHSLPPKQATLDWKLLLYKRHQVFTISTSTSNIHTNCMTCKNHISLSRIIQKDLLSQHHPYRQSKFRRNWHLIELAWWKLSHTATNPKVSTTTILTWLQPLGAPDCWLWPACHTHHLLSSQTWFPGDTGHMGHQHEYAPTAWRKGGRDISECTTEHTYCGIFVHAMKTPPVSTTCNSLH